VAEQTQQERDERERQSPVLLLLRRSLFFSNNFTATNGRWQVGSAQRPGRGVYYVLTVTGLRPRRHCKGPGGHRAPVSAIVCQCAPTHSARPATPAPGPVAVRTPGTYRCPQATPALCNFPGHRRPLTPLQHAPLACRA
jgi:hypothetical protein